MDLKRVRNLAIVLAVLVGYALVCHFTAFRIPCPFYTVTGLKCPGCGMTRMCMDIMHLDFKAAYLENRAIFVTLPVLGWFLGYNALRYVGVIKGERLKKPTEIIGWCLVAVYVIFGFVRNFAGM